MYDLVSIVVPLFNAEHTISKTIDSVLEQTYKNFELIIIDDASSDSSVDIVMSYVEKDHRIHLLRLKQNSGAAVARNAGIEAAHGKYIAFLDSDDIWLPEKLEKHISFIKENKLVFSFTSYIKVNNLGKTIGKVSVPTKSVNYKTLLKTNLIGCSTVILDVESIGKYYMPDIRKRQDHCLWLKILKDGHLAVGYQLPLTLYTVSTKSLSGNKLSAAKYQWKVYRQIEGLSVIKSIYYLSNWAIHGFIKFIN